MGVGGERQTGQVVLFGPFVRGVDELPTDPLPRMVRVHGNLLDVRMPIESLDQQIRHGVVVLVSEDQESVGFLKRGQVRDARRVVLRNEIAEITEGHTCRSLHLLEHGQIIDVSATNHGPGRAVAGSTHRTHCHRGRP